MTQQTTEWFQELCPEAGSALRLQVTEPLHAEQSHYQKIEVYQTTHWGRLLVIDGLIMLTQRDNFLYHEMLAHPALFSHPAPRQVAIIGGGDCGTLLEVAKHPEVERIVQIDIDERVTRVAEQFFPELCAANQDPRVELLFLDGIRWMEQAPPASLDLIIVDSTDPIGPGEALFSPPFYAACRRALRNPGLLVQQSESPLLHLPILQRMQRQLREAGFAATRPLLFPQPSYTSGWWSATLAGNEGALELLREAAAEARPFTTHYYCPATHRAALALPPFLQQQLAVVE